MNIRGKRTYLKLVVSCSFIRTEQQPLGVRDQLVIRKEVFESAIGFVATTPVLFVAPLIVLATLNPMSDLNVGGASKE